MQNKMMLWKLASCFLILGFAILIGSGMARRGQEPTTSQEPSTAEEQEDSDALNQLIVKATEAFSAGRYQEAFESASKICKLKPNNTRYQGFLGETAFAAGQFDKCVAAYDEVIRMDPRVEPQLWQRGLALYYADRFADGVRQFETHQTVNSQDVENAVWHLLCAARISDVDQARKKLIPITGDTRVPMSQIYEMFAGRMTPDDVLKTAQTPSSRAPAGSGQAKLQLYYAHLYTGLYHEMLGDQQAAIASLKKAEEINPMGKTNFMGQVARVHLKLRETASDNK
jgi:lipoprotein NlpI